MSTKFVVVGRFGRAHGVKGLIRVFSFTNPMDNIVHYTPWFVKNNEVWQQLDITIEAVQSRFLLVKEANHPTRETVDTLVNKEIAVSETKLPKLLQNEFYWHQLIGLKVYNKDKQLLGEVSEIMPTGANDVLVVKADKTTLIPYVWDKYILAVSIEHGRIDVDWSLDF